jgi:hypothetical protein
MAKSARRSIVPFRAPTIRPIVIRQTKVQKSKKHHRRSGGGGRGLMSKNRMGLAIAAFGVAVIEKHMGAQLPKLPMIGTMGTIGVAAYFLSDNGRNKLADEICTSALVIAAYQLGESGAIIGEDGTMNGYVAGV